MISAEPQNMTFLIVDDQDNMRRSIRAMLKLIGFGKEYFEAADGQEAWKILQDEAVTIDFIIADWHMPKMNGTELLNLVRTTRRLRETPFLMITAEANQTIVAEAAENDVDAYLTKPFVTATLEQKIQELIHHANHPSKLSILLKKAAAWREKGELDKAIECALAAATLNKRSSRPLRELGRLYLKKGDLEAGRKCFARAVSLNRLDVPSYHYLGQIHFKTGDHDEAVKYFMKALQLSPRHADRAFKVALLMLEMGKKQEAERVFKIMLRNNQDNRELYEDVAAACLDHGLYGLAIRTLNVVLEDGRGRADLQKKLAHAYLMDGHPKEAIVILEELVKRNSDDLDILLDLAQGYLDIKLKMRADKWATRAARLDPGNERARTILDQCL